MFSNLCNKNADNGFRRKNAEKRLPPSQIVFEEKSKLDIVR